MLFGLLSSQAIRAYQVGVSPHKRYRCAHAICHGEASCSQYAAQLLHPNSGISKEAARQAIAARLKACKAVSDVAGLSTAKATWVMLGKYGLVGAAGFLASAGVFAATCATGDGGGGGGCGGGGGGSASADNCPTTLPKADMVQGRVYFAPTDGTQVFWDDNGNWTKDPGEEGAWVDAEGRYAIKNRVFANAKLVAETNPWVSDRMGVYSGHVLMSATNADPTRISPFTTLADLSGRSAADVEGVLGVPANTVLRPELLTSDASVWRSASVVRSLLRRQREELQEFGQADVGKAVMTHLGVLSSGGTLQAPEDLAAAADARLKVSSASPNRRLPQASSWGVDATAGAPSVSSAWTKPSSVGLQYVWVNKVDPLMEPFKYDAVQRIVADFKNYGIGLTANAQVVDLERLDSNTISSLLKRLADAGVPADEQEKAVTASIDVHLNALFKERQTQLDNLEAQRGGVGDYAYALLSDPGIYLGATQYAFGVIQTWTGVPVGSLDAKASFVANWSRRQKNAMFVINLAAVAGKCAVPVYRLQSDEFSIAALQEISDNMLAVLKCGAFDGQFPAFASAITKLVLGGGTLVSEANKYGVAPTTEGMLRVVAEVFSLHSDLFATSPDPFSLRLAGAMGIMAGWFQVRAEGYAAGTRATASLEEAYAAVAHSFDKKIEGDQRRKSLIKLRYRLSKVLRVELSWASGSYAGASCTATDRRSVCQLRRLVGASGAAAGRATALAAAQATDTPAGTVRVDYGDGWNTDTDPATAGKVLTGNERLEHDYLTYGRYRVVTTTTVLDKRYTHVEEVHIVPPNPTAPAADPSIAALSGSAKQGVGVAVNVTLKATPGSTFQGITAVAEALTASDEVLGTCSPSFNLPSGNFAPGSYFASGCASLNLSNAQRVRVSVSAVSSASNQTAKSSVMLTVDRSSGSGALTLNNFTAAQAGDGLPMVGSFNLDGNLALSMLRVHAGRSGDASDACFLDLLPTVGQKSFTFTGNWLDQNNLKCSALLPPAGGSTALRFKLEVKDATGTAVPNVATPITATYRATAVATPTVAQHSPATVTLNQVATFSYTGANLVSGMGYTVSNCDGFVDLGGSSTTRSFTCTPRALGDQVLTVKAAPGGQVLYNGRVTVNANATEPPAKVNGACGSANGVAAAQKPAANLCSAGNATAVAGTGPWTWNCTGSQGGTTASCSAPLAAPATCVGQWDGRTYPIGAVEERFTNTCPSGTTGQVRSFHTCQAGGVWSPVATSDNCTAVLQPPANASVASVNNGIQVTWSTVAGATGYRVYRDNSLVSTISGGLTSSTIDTGVLSGVRYCYAIEASSSLSTPVTVSARVSAGCTTYSPGPPPLVAPSNVSAAQIPGGGIRVSWSASTGAEGYLLTRQNDGQGWDLPASATSYSDLSVTPGISYAYVVQAKRGAERSPQSVQANAIAPMVPVNGSCGSANGVPAMQKPAANLCSAGSASGVSGTGPWSWSCSGTHGGSAASCSAPLASPQVSGFSPKSGARGSAVVVTVTGANLPDTLALAIANVTCTNKGLFSSTTTQQFDCTIPSTAPLGMAMVTVKDRPGGSTLLQTNLSQGFEIR